MSQHRSIGLLSNRFAAKLLGILLLLGSHPGCARHETLAKPASLLIQPAAVQTVILLQIDGLSVDLLDQYLADGQARQSGRILHRVLGVAPVTHNPLRYTRAVRGSALTVLPALPEPAAATLLTGLPPNRHGVRSATDKLAPDATTLFTLLRGAPTASVGYGSGASFVADGQDDRERLLSLRVWLSHLDAPACLVALRLETLAKRQREDGPWAELGAIGQLDDLLGTLSSPSFDWNDDRTVVVLTAGYAGKPFALEPKPIPQAKLAALRPELATTPLHVAGGLVWTQSPDRRAAAALASIPNIAAVVQRTPAGLQLYDVQGDRFRALEKEDVPANWSAFEERTLGFLRPDEVMAVADRGVGAIFTGQQDRPPLTGSGGPDAEESVVPLVLAGQPLAGTRWRLPPDAALLDVAPTILALLANGKQAPAALGQGRTLLHALSGEVADPSEPDLMSCRADTERIGTLGAAAQASQSCRRTLASSRSRTAVAEALLALAVLKRRGDAPAAYVDRLISAAYILTDRPRWPKGEALRRSRGSGQCQLHDTALLAFGCPAAVQRAIEGQKDTWALPSDGRPVSLDRCELSSQPSDDVDIAELLARLSGAEAAVDCSRDRSRVLALTPALSAWVGPVSFDESVARQGDLTARLGAAVHFSRGLTAWHRGLWRQSSHHLRAAGTLPLPAEAWRVAFLPPSTYHTTDGVMRYTAWENVMTTLPRFRSDDAHWALVVAEQLDALSGRRPLRELIAWRQAYTGIEDADRSHPSITTEPPQGAWRDARARFLSAAKTLNETTDFCQKAKPEQRLRDLDDARSVFTAQGSSAMEARALAQHTLVRISQMDLPGTIADAQRTMDTLRQPGARWVSANVSYTLLSTMLGQNVYEVQAPDVLQQARREYLLFEQRQRDASKQDRMELSTDRQLQQLLDLADPVLLQGMPREDLKRSIDAVLNRQLELKRKLLTKLLDRTLEPIQLLNLLSNPQRLALDWESISVLTEAALESPVNHTNYLLERELAVGRPLAKLLHAGSLVLIGHSAAALTVFSEVEQQLLDTDDTLYEGRVAALRAEEREGAASMAAYGPYLKMTLFSMKALIHLFINKDLPNARKTIKTLLASVDSFAQREILRLKLDPQIAADASRFAAVLDPLVDLAFAMFDKIEAAGALSIQRDLAAKLQKINIEPGCTVVREPTAGGKTITRMTECRLTGASLTANRWLRLAEVLVKDTHVLANRLIAQKTAGAAAGDLGVAISGQLAKLSVEWKEEIRREGRQGDLRDHALTLLQGAESAIEDVHCLELGDFDKIVPCAKNTSFGLELAQIVQDLRNDPVLGVQSKREAQILQNDSLQTLLVDLFLSALDEQPRSGVWSATAAPSLGQRGRLMAQRLVSRIDDLASRPDWPSARNNRVMLGVLPLLFVRVLPSDLVRSRVDAWLLRMREHLEGTNFRGAGWFFELLSYQLDRSPWDGSLANAGFRGRLDRLSEVQKQCPALAGWLDMARAGIAFWRGQNDRGYELIDRYIENVVHSERGNPELNLSVEVQHDNTKMGVSLALDASRMINPASSNLIWNLSLGWSPAPQRSYVVTTGYRPSGSSPAQAIGQALAVRAWNALQVRAMEGAELAVADRTLADLTALGAGLEPRFLLRNPSPQGRNLASLDVFADPLLGLWLASVADVRGFHTLAEQLLRMTERSAQWHQSQNALSSECGEDDPAPPPWPDPLRDKLSGGALFVLENARCYVPHALPDESKAFRQLAYLRWQRYLHERYSLGELRVDSAAWHRAVAAVQAQLHVELQPERSEVALSRKGYDCEAGARRLSRQEPAQTLLPPVERCGSSGLLLEALASAAATSEEPKASLKYISQALALTQRFSLDVGFGSVLLHYMSKVVERLIADRPEEMPDWLRQIAQQLQKEEWAQPVALYLRTLALATEYLLGYQQGEPYAPLLRQVRKQAPMSSSHHYLGQLDRALFLLNGRDQHREVVTLSRKLIRGEL